MNKQLWKSLQFCVSVHRLLNFTAIYGTQHYVKGVILRHPDITCKHASTQLAKCEQSVTVWKCLQHIT